MTKNRTKLNIKLLIVLIVLIITIIFGVRYFLKARNSVVRDSINYTEKGELKYSVCLVENRYIEESCFSEKRSFITDLIDYIIINFDYSFSASDLVNYDYQYIVKASVVANERNDQSKIVYTKDEVLINQNMTNNKANINILESIKVDYQKYNDLITEFKKTYFLSLDSRLSIIAEIKINGKNDKIDDEINDTKKLQIVIPLAEQTTNIDLENAKIENKGFLKQTAKTNITFLEYGILSLFGLIIISLLFIVGRYIKQIRINNKKYTGVIRGILKHYDGIVAITKTMPVLTDFKVIEMSSFDELLDVRNNLGKPILFYENDSKTDANFMILNNDEIYIFKIKRDD